VPNYSPQRENLEGVQACRKRLFVPISPLQEPKFLIGQEFLFVPELLYIL